MTFTENGPFLLLGWRKKVEGDIFCGFGGVVNLFVERLE